MLTIASATVIGKNILTEETHGESCIFDMQLSKVKRAQQMINERLTQSQLVEIRCIINDEIDVTIDINDLSDIFDLFPYERGVLATCGKDDFRSTDLREMIFNVIAVFFIGCQWPTYGDSRESGIDNLAELITNKIESQVAKFYSEDFKNG
jgi:hypothetical protein